MVRPSVLLLLCGSLLLPMTAVARLPGPLQAVPAAKVRDLSEIRSSRVLRVLVVCLRCQRCRRSEKQVDDVGMSADK